MPILIFIWNKHLDEGLLTSHQTITKTSKQHTTNIKKQHSGFITGFKISILLVVLLSPKLPPQKTCNLKLLTCNLKHFKYLFPILQTASFLREFVFLLFLRLSYPVILFPLANPPIFFSL